MHRCTATIMPRKAGADDCYKESSGSFRLAPCPIVDELLQLVDQSDFAAFWDLLTQSTDDNGYAIQSHTLELKPNFSLI
jgi:hypothetical protein